MSLITNGGEIFNKKGTESLCKQKAPGVFRNSRSLHLHLLYAYFRYLIADWAAAKRAIGTRNGEQLT